MPFLITGLDPAPYLDLFESGDEALRAAGARRVVADEPDAFRAASP